MALEDEIRRLAIAIETFTQRAFPGLPQPQPFTIQLVSERRENEMSFLTYEATLPAVPEGADVAAQKLTVTVDGVAAEPQTLPLDAATATFEVPQDSSVSLSLVYEDDATPPNVSAPREQSFVAKDTIAPDAPGEFGEIAVISERQ